MPSPIHKHPTEKPAPPPHGGMPEEANKKISAITEILFGEKMAEYDHRFSDLDHRVHSETDRIAERLEKTMHELEERLMKQLEKAAQSLEKEHTERLEALGALERSVGERAGRVKEEMKNELSRLFHGLSEAIHEPPPPPGDKPKPSRAKK